jgi:hypothetical protein
VDELELAGAEHLDPAYVAGYDRKAAFAATDDLAELRKLGLDSEATLVDLGAGTGTLAFAAAAVCRRVVAVDVSPAMVAAMQARPGIENVEVVEAGLVYACEPHELGEVVSAWVAGGVDRPEDGWTRAEREQHVREEFSTFSWLLESMLERTGFETERAEFRSRIYADYVCRLTARPARARRPTSPGA